jgi:hypothetical protein
MSEQNGNTRVLFTFYVHFTHRMEPLQSTYDTRSLFDACLALLLGVTDAESVKLLAKLDRALLHHLNDIAEEMRTFIRSPDPPQTSNECFALMHELHLCVSSFGAVFELMPAKDFATLCRAQQHLVNCAYVPLREVHPDTFVAECTANMQLLQLFKMRQCIPTLDVSRYGVWRLPASVRLYRVERSIEFYGFLLFGPPVGDSKPFLGCDAIGPFVVGSRESMRVLQTVMFKDAARCRLYKSTLFYPLLARLYMLDGLSTALGRLVMRDAFVQVLAHWLLVERQSPASSAFVLPHMDPHSTAFSLLCNVHVAVNVLWDSAQIDDVADDTGFYARLTALRNMLVMGAPHWMPLALLQELDDACARCAIGAQNSAQLVHALRLLMERTNFDAHGYAESSADAAATDEDAGFGGARPPRVFRWSSGEVPLAVCAGANLLEFCALLCAEDHPFYECYDDGGRLMALNEAVYECVMILYPALSSSVDPALRTLCSRVMLSMLTLFRPLRAESYRRSLYITPERTAPQAVRYDEGGCISEYTVAAYCPRTDLLAGEVVPLLVLLQRLERLVCVDNTPLAPFTCESTAASLAHYFRTDSPGRCTPAVATYHDTDSAEERGVSFDLGLCLVDFPCDEECAKVDAAELRQHHRSCGNAGLSTASRAMNVAHSMVDVFDARTVASAALTDRTLNAALRRGF